MSRIDEAEEAILEELRLLSEQEIEDDPEDNVIYLFGKPDQGNILAADPDEDELLLNQAELLDALEDIKERILALEIRGLIIIGVAKHHSKDLTFASSSIDAELPRIVGALDLLKSQLAYEHMQNIGVLDEIDDYFD